METDKASAASWYVVATKLRQETVALQNLKRQSYEVFLPQITLRKRRRGKWQEVIEPLFPGYLFVALEAGVDDAAPIRSTLGCVGLVRFGAVWSCWCGLELLVRFGTVWRF